VLDEALGFFDDHFRDLHVARGGLVERGTDDLALDRTRHVRDFLGAFVDQQHDQVDFRMVGRDSVRDVLQHHGFAGARRRDDEPALALAERTDQIDDPRRIFLLAGFLQFELEVFVRVERRQVVERDAVPRFVRVLEVDAVDLEKRKIALCVLGRADFALDGVARAQAELADLARRYVDVVRSGEIIGFRRAQKAEAVRQNFQNAIAVDGFFLLGLRLQDGEHHFLLAHRSGVFNMHFFGKSQQFGGRFGLQFP